ncbi:MAG TPA: sensor histidine kinase, partial [Thermomicrobiales bacterium]|nr:sensor histidine kinase [Thermomicrobiales bacterium]
MTLREDGENARQPTATNGDHEEAGQGTALPLDPSLPEADLRWVVDALAARRDEVLRRWTDAVAEQAFHSGRRTRAVADDIPRLYDTLLAYLRRGAPPWRDPGAPFEDEAVLAAARSHAQARADQGLEPGEIVTEFRLLRREIWRALRGQLNPAAPHPDVISTEFLVNDALDGAIAVGLAALGAKIEEMREDFLVTTIHEVRQPITAIRGTAQFAGRLLARPQIDTEQVTELLEQIVRHADRMTGLLDVLADASRAALGHLELSRERVDLRDLVQDSIATLTPADARRVQVRLLSGDDPAGEWDRPRLRQVVTNLLTNAAKYSSPDQPIEVSISAAERELRLSVRDHGIGLAPDDLTEVFRRYFRSRVAVADGIEGLGLGLYLSRQIIDAHGG